MRTIVIGDIHGRVKVVRKVLALPDTHCIFVGDIVDSFDRDINDQVSCLEEILSAPNFTLIPGNHEMGYVDRKHSSAGTTNAMRIHFEQFRRVLCREVWKPFVIEQGHLITHAGVTRYLVETCGLNRGNIEDALIEWWDEACSPYFWIGKARNGDDKVGGPLWCDWDMEFSDPFEQIELKQIVGHTRRREHQTLLRPTKFGSVCIDVLDTVDSCVIELLDGEVITIDLTTEG